MICSSCALGKRGIGTFLGAYRSCIVLELYFIFLPKYIHLFTLSIISIIIYYIYYIAIPSYTPIIVSFSLIALFVLCDNTQLLYDNFLLILTAMIGNGYYLITRHYLFY